jgi:2-polyprenyl-3-methyl-5-hydroxy-6-metoxy-1,4-benzoquinol methylase
VDDHADVPAPTPLTWTPAARRRFWAWEHNFPEHYFSGKYGRSIVQVLARYVRPGQRVLDYACGAGFLSAHLLRRFRVDVWATDESAQAIDATMARNSAHRRFHSATTVDVLLRQGLRFDRIVAVELVEHLDDDQLRLFFERVGCLLAPAGMLVVTAPNAERLDRKMVLCPNCNRTFHRWQHVRSVTPGSLARLAAQHGFHVRETLEIDFARRGPVGHLLRRYPRLTPVRALPRPHLVGALAPRRSGIPDA